MKPKITRAQLRNQWEKKMETVNTGNFTEELA